MKMHIVLLLMMFLAFISCKKEENISVKNDLEWIRVFEDTISRSTDDEMYQGLNGKVLTDKLDNIYLYYLNSNSKQSVVIKYDPKGNLVWKKIFPDCEPLDMVLLSDGSIILAVRFDPAMPNGLVLYAIRSNGTIEAFPTNILSSGSATSIDNALLYTMPDNSLLISGSFLDAWGTSLVHSGYMLKTSSVLSNVLWRTAIDLNTILTFQYSWLRLSFGQNSIVPTPNNQYLFEYAISDANLGIDSVNYGLVTGLLNSNGTLDTMYFLKTGHSVSAFGRGEGYANRYCNGLYLENKNSPIFHYSSPQSFTTNSPEIPNGFIRIGNDAKMKDTIPISLPNGYRIVSCVPGNGRFLMMAYKTGIISGTDDFSANHTLFLTGDGNWHVTKTFTLQEYYADFFPSAAPTSDGGYVIMGKIQSFNNPINKLVLFKLNN
jgi:hypothetical protein